MGTKFANSNVEFVDLKYFTGLTTIPNKAFQNVPNMVGYRAPYQLKSISEGAGYPANGWGKSGVKHTVILGDEENGSLFNSFSYAFPYYQNCAVVMYCKPFTWGSNPFANEFYVLDEYVEGFIAKGFPSAKVKPMSTWTGRR